MRGCCYDIMTVFAEAFNCFGADEASASDNYDFHKLMFLCFDEWMLLMNSMRQSWCQWDNRL